ncbi:hypothetical protein GCM10011352_04700 [Marinobacterium zhoushanense]|uniref:Helicase ATP-binding domain-containing protein n=1 Tax=Marinobacterium zhoushanense TaxID=1679163 RepID=A0ABQ1K229_9GAMM|nr:protein DpdE [Marinobacterium zhoushanense]GGB81972.1 hypothetical protein GCM10011352_04700 [Marinobacterium zhoushanense]
MATDTLAGKLVQSDHFDGIAKIYRVDREAKTASIGFFESPAKKLARTLEVPLSSLRKASLSEATNLYFLDEETGILRRGQFGGTRPNNMLLVFLAGEIGVEVSEQHIFVPNIPVGSYHDVENLILNRVFDGSIDPDADKSKKHAKRRSDFIETYLKQKSISGGFPGFLASSVELESHQIAVVKRIQQDTIRKYLLADEVGLGKTIEAGLLILNHLYERTGNVNVLISVPANLVEQWEDELATRFYIDSSSLSDGSSLEVISHEELSLYDDSVLTMLVVDEAHQVVPSSTEGVDPIYSAHQHYCDVSEETLLLTGTPVGGNELQYLGLLSLLSPSDYSFDSIGLTKFKRRLDIQCNVGGIYASLRHEAGDAVIATNLARLRDIAEESELLSMVERASELYDPFFGEDTEEREDLLSSIRSYIERNFKLFHRMIRNRRDVADIASLFPGLAGAVVEYFEVSGESLEDLVLRYFEQSSIVDIEDSSTDLKKLYALIDSYFSGPLSLLETVKTGKVEFQGFTTSEVEKIVKACVVARSHAMQQTAENWLEKCPNGLVLVYLDDEGERLHFIDCLGSSSILRPVEVTNEERYRHADLAEFNVYVGGRAMEDGFNFHGVDRLVVHGSLPRTLQRFEQRMGRVNRYSANLRGVKAVPSVIVAPSTEGVYWKWADLLSKHVGVFDKTLASIINPIEKSLGLMWEEVLRSGIKVLDSWGSDVLSGKNGIIERETRAVQGQEVLLVMENEILAANAFSLALSDYEEDEGSEESNKFNPWITKTLKLTKRREGNSEAFRYAYKTAKSNYDRQSLLNYRAFRRKCYFGLDFSGESEDSTFPMSMSRSYVSANPGTIPCRYGVPFIDAIYELLLDDPRGVTSGQVYFDIEKAQRGIPPDLKLAFRIEWVSGIKTLSRQAQVLNSQSDNLKVTWVDQAGNVTEDDPNAPTTDKKYAKLDLIPSTWVSLDQGNYLSEKDWRYFSENAFEKSREFLLASGFADNKKGLLPISCYARVVLD